MVKRRHTFAKGGEREKTNKALFINWEYITGLVQLSPSHSKYGNVSNLSICRTIPSGPAQDVRLV